MCRLYTTRIAGVMTVVVKITSVGTVLCVLLQRSPPFATCPENLNPVPYVMFAIYQPLLPQDPSDHRCQQPRGLRIHDTHTRDADTVAPVRRRAVRSLGQAHSRRLRERQLGERCSRGGQRGCCVRSHFDHILLLGQFWPPQPWQRGVRVHRLVRVDGGRRVAANRASPRQRADGLGGDPETIPRGLHEQGKAVAEAYTIATGHTGGRARGPDRISNSFGGDQGAQRAVNDRQPRLKYLRACVRA